MNRIFIKLTALFVLVAVLLCFVVACAGPPGPPPPPRVTMNKPPKPHPGAVWAEGHWEWKHRRWIWIPGHWR